MSYWLTTADKQRFFKNYYSLRYRDMMLSYEATSYIYRVVEDSSLG